MSATAVRRMLDESFLLLDMVLPLPLVLRKVFEVGALSPDFGRTLMKKSYFQRTIYAKYSKDGTWRA